MKLIKSILVTLFLVLNLSCSTQTKIESNPREYQVGSYLWFQTSGEFRALCYQAYNYAKLILDSDLKNKHKKKRAIVFDIDETVLDNSAGGAYEIKNHLKWSRENLNRWVSLRAAEAIPGAREFIQYAVSKKVEIIYISNRSDAQKDDTYENLVKLNIPVIKENLYFSSNSFSKESRRLEVQKNYDVVLFLGDNLSDFHKDWDNKSSDERRALVDQHRQDFGEKFIILPNPLYGDWEYWLPKKENRLELLKSIP